MKRGVAAALGLALFSPVSASSNPAPEAVLAELPFVDEAGGNRIVVDLAPEGSHRPLPLALDTGATYSMMTAALARELGVAVRVAKNTPYRRATRLGRDLHFMVDTRRGDAASSTPAEPGLLGGNFLAEYVVEINFAERRVRFLDPRQYRVPEEVGDPTEAVLPLQVVSQRPHTEVEVDGETLRVLIDTGDPFGLSLLKESAHQRGIDPVPVRGLDVQGIGGPVRAELGEAKRVRFGALELEGVPVLLYRSDYNQGDASGAALGVDFLAQLEVRIDYPRRRMWMRRSRQPRVALLGGDYRQMRRTGVHLESRDDAVFVRYVFPETPATRLGLRPGDWVSPFVLEELKLDLADLHRRIEEGGTLTVVRESTDGWIDVELPEAGIASDPPSRAGDAR